MWRSGLLTLGSALLGFSLGVVCTVGARELVQRPPAPVLQSVALLTMPQAQPSPVYDCVEPQADGSCSYSALRALLPKIRAERQRLGMQ